MKLCGLYLLILLTPVIAMAEPVAIGKVYLGIPMETSMPFLELENEMSKPKIKRGLLQDFGIALFQEMGLTPVWVLLPKKRAAPDLISGEVSLICYTHPKWLPVVHNQVLWSKDIATNTNFIVSLGKKRVSKIEELYGQRVGGIVNFYYPTLDPLFEKGLIIKESGPNNISNIQKLIHGRLDYLVLSNMEFDYHHKTYPQIVADNLGLDTIRVKCAVSKKSKVSLEQVDKAIDALNKKGILKKIFPYQGER